MFNTNSHNFEVENYSYGITRSFLDGGHIVAIQTEGDMSRNAINTWASLLVLTMQEWKSERPLAVLHDLTHPNQGLTPFARERTMDVLRARPKDMEIYNAILLPPTFIYRIIEMFLRTPIFQQDGLYIEVFSRKEEALEWLQEHPER
jgi:hypothetical protein